MKTIQTNLIITSFSSKVDGSLRLSAVTPELTPKEKVAFMEIQNQNIDAVLSPYKEAPSEEIKVVKEVNQKTQSQRLRGVIFVLWEKEGKQGEFEAFYNHKMEMEIEKFKRQIDN